MNYSYKIFTYVCTLLFLCSCQQEPLSAEELSAYVVDPSNHFLQTKQVNGVEVSVTYQPTDLLISRDNSSDLTLHNIDSLRSKYSRSAYFLLSFSKNGHEVLDPKAGFSEYSQLLQILAFQMNNYVQLTNSKGDTMRLSNYYLDRTYASGTASQLLLVFPNSHPHESLKFHLSEFGLGTGNMVFSFKSALDKSAPALKID